MKDTVCPKPPNPADFTSGHDIVEVIQNNDAVLAGSTISRVYFVSGVRANRLILS
jgi:hypothetical protein